MHEPCIDINERQTAESSMPLRSRQRTTSNTTHLDHPILLFRMQQLLRIFQSWLRITIRRTFSHHYPGRYICTILHGISIFNIWAFIHPLSMGGKLSVIHGWEMGSLTGPTWCLWHFLFFTSSNCTIEKALLWHRSSKRTTTACAGYPHGRTVAEFMNTGMGLGIGLRNSHE